MPCVVDLVARLCDLRGIAGEQAVHYFGTGAARSSLLPDGSPQCTRSHVKTLEVQSEVAEI